MMKFNHREYSEPIGHFGYCDRYDEVLEVTGTRIWRQPVGGKIRYAIADTRCPYSGKCTLKGDCNLVKEAYREWRKEATEQISAMQD